MEVPPEQQPRNLDQQHHRRQSKLPIKVPVSRSFTIIFLLISLILLFTLKNTDKVTGALPPMPPEPHNKGISSSSHSPPPPPDNTQPTFKISELGSLRSVLTVSVIGIGCNIFQLAMLIYCMVTGKNLTRNKYIIFFDYCCDKVVALLLAASAGAGLGSMLDIRQVRPSFKYLGSFMSLEKISTTLLASAMVSTSVSSTSSAKAFEKYRRTVEKGQKTAGMLGTWANKAYNYCCCH